LEKNLTLTRVKKDGNIEVYQRKAEREDERKDLRAAVEAGEGCRL
jgi:hypothetical protein